MSQSAVRGAQPTLTGRHVHLRPWLPTDAPAVFTACQDAEIQGRTTVPVPYTRQDAEHFVGPMAAATWAAGGALFAIEPRVGGELAGSIGVLHLNDGLAAIGYWASPWARGRGYISDALRVLTDWVIHQLGAARVELVVQPDNSASRRVAARAGYVEEGTLRGRLLLRGRRVDVVMCAVLSDDQR